MDINRGNFLDESAQSVYVEGLTDQDVVKMMLNSEQHKELEESSGFENGLMELQDPAIKKQSYHAEYRAWYGTQNKPRWCPQQSKYKGRGGNHDGVDLFAVSGTQLVALTNGSIQWNPRGANGKWGNHIFLNFTSRGSNYTIVYAHLGSLIGVNNRKVRAGEVICTSGCSGNTTYCGIRNKCGGLEDHVHLELFSPGGRIDPIAAFGWNVKYANDHRCIFPSCT